VLTGKLKTDYQREYMRRRRAGLPTAKPRQKAEWKPSRRTVEQVSHWVRVAHHRPWRLRGLGAQVLAGMTFVPDQDGKIQMTDAVWAELCRRYKTLTDQRRAEREREREEAAKPRPPRCMFCGEAKSPQRIMVGNGSRLICEQCVAESAAIVAEQRS
jgi:ClpX C4-type zinc finger